MLMPVTVINDTDAGRNAWRAMMRGPEMPRALAASM